MPLKTIVALTFGMLYNIPQRNMEPESDSFRGQSCEVWNEG